VVPQTDAVGQHAPLRQVEVEPQQFATPVLETQHVVPEAQHAVVLDPEHAVVPPGQGQSGVVPHCPEGRHELLIQHVPPGHTSKQLPQLVQAPGCPQIWSGQQKLPGGRLQQVLGRQQLWVLEVQQEVPQQKSEPAGQQLVPSHIKHCALAFLTPRVA